MKTPGERFERSTPLFWHNIRGKDWKYFKSSSYKAEIESSEVWRWRFQKHSKKKRVLIFLV
jgi:hypothetical protein